MDTRPDRTAEPDPAPARVPELDRRRTGRLPRILVGIALALPVLLVIGVLIGSQLIYRGPPPDGPAADKLSVASVPLPDAAGADCAHFLSGLPDAMNTGVGLLPRRVLADPAPAGTAAWGGAHEDSGRIEDQPVILRCGLSRPPELTPTAALLDVDGVEWVAVRDAGLPGITTWVTADRAVYVGLTLPDGVGSGPIQDISRGVKITLASRPVGR